MRSKIIEQVQHIFICNPKLQNTFRNSEEKPPSIFIKRMLSFLLKKKTLHKIYSNLNSHQYEGGDIMKRKRRDHLTCLNCSIHLFTCEMTRFGNHWLFRLFVETMSLSIIDCNSPPKPQVMFTFWKRYLLQ